MMPREQNSVERYPPMQPYKAFRPTGFDATGIGSTTHGIGDFLVLLARNRDSDLLTQSNFDCALQELGGESDTVQVHRFGHWACGWFELILIDPADEKATETAQEIEDSLADYPILNDEHHSELEFTEASRLWEHTSMRERVEVIQRYGRNEKVSVFAARRDEMPQGLYYSDWINAC